jgi:hypothetical protein
VNNNEVNRPKRLKVVAAVTATLGLLSGVLLFAEHDASARTIPTAASLLARQAAGVTPQAAPATAQQLLPDTATQAQVLAMGQQIAGQSTAAVQALQLTPSPVTSVICAALLAQRAAVVQNFNILIAQFPAFTAALVTQENAALAVIDFALRTFGCPVPSGTAL